MLVVGFASGVFKSLFFGQENYFNPAFLIAGGK
jgi:uncharacterized membrane protein YjjP (DUF1212 family)